MPTKFVDTIITYRILRLLTTPFEETEAFKLGIIDNKGRELMKMKDLNTVAERDAYTLLHRLVYRLKRIVEKVPLENKKFLSFAAALALIKEHVEMNKEPIDLERQYLDKLNQEQLTEEIMQVETFFSEGLKPFRFFIEDAPANNIAATPGIDGYTPDTIGVKRKKRILTRMGIKNV